MSGSHGSSVRQVESGDGRSLLDSLHIRDGKAGLFLTGLVVIGLGVLAWKYIGPDLKQYMKIRDM